MLLAFVFVVGNDMTPLNNKRENNNNNNNRLELLLRIKAIAYYLSVNEG
jgi:hypothetical protein